MSAHDPKIEDSAIAAELGRALNFLLDSKSRERIVGAYLRGQIDGDTAMDALVDLGLIEVPDE